MTQVRSNADLVQEQTDYIQLGANTLKSIESLEKMDSINSQPLYTDQDGYQSTEGFIYDNYNKKLSKQKLHVTSKQSLKKGR